MLADVRGVVAEAGGQLQVGDHLRRQPQLAEHGLGGFVLLLDHQHLVAAAVALQVVAEIGLQAPGQVQLAQGVQPVVLVAPEGVVIEHVDGAWAAEVVVGGVVPGAPVVVVSLQINAEAIVGLIVDLGGRQVFVAGVDVSGHAERRGIVQGGVGVQV